MRTSTRLACALAVAAAACGGAPSGGGSGTAADFALRDLDGDWVRLSDHLGKDVVLINFWATWCAPCSGELPHLEALYREYRDRGFVVLAVSMDGPESAAEVAPHARRYGLTFPVLLDEETRVVGSLNPRRAAPYNILIDRSGTIVLAKEGYSAGDEAELEAAVAELL